MTPEIANKIVAETERGYDAISDKFSETRKYFWRSLEFIAGYTREGDTVLDFGCGNGRLLELFADKNIGYYGADISGKLLERARENHVGEHTHFSKLEPSQTSLSFQDNYFNAVYSIATFHHFPGKEYRESWAKELYRVTKPEGRIIVTVWNLWQRNYLKDIVRNWKNKITGHSELDWNDCYISFTDNRGNVFKRYHHAFTARELTRLFARAGFEKELVKIDKNIVYIGKK